MRVGEFLHDRAMSLLLHLFCMLALSIFLGLTGTGRGAIVIILMVWGMGLCLLNVAAYFRRRSQIQELQAIMDGLEKKYLFMECSPRPGSYVERKYFELCRRAGKSMIKRIV